MGMSWQLDGMDDDELTDDEVVDDNDSKERNEMMSTKLAIINTNVR